MSPKPLPAPAHAFIVVGGRRWRTSDPGIPEHLRQLLVNELMAARRAVRDAGSARELRRSRDRVNDAKIALGERGPGWWLPPTPAAVSRRIEAAMLALLRARSPGTPVSPSEIARIVGGSRWRPLLPAVRERAVAMRERGELDILERGVVLKTNATGGALRYRLRPTVRARTGSRASASS